MKIITFSLWGNNPKYCIGAIKNSILSKNIYPEWQSRFYVHSNVEESILDQLENNGSEVIILEKADSDWKGMFWRFLPAYDDKVEAFICRDTDSRLNERESSAVFEWMNSDKNVHIMRDHPYHGYSMLGGMIGFKKPIFDTLKTCLKQFSPSNNYGSDYEFFNNLLYPTIKNDCITHDEIFEKKPFPTVRKKYQFVGQVFNEDDLTVSEHEDALKQSLQK